MTDKINIYISEQSCANICCIDEQGKPYCFTCFYAYNSDEQLLYYKSSAEANHSAMLNNHPFVAGTILPDKLNKLHIRGLQFEGEVLPHDHPLAKDAASVYYTHNPMAIAMPGELWTIRINSMKYTDNKLGFGKKLLWNRLANAAAMA